jgi:hypothetical protein
MGDWIVGLMMAIFGLLGLVLVSGAADTGMYVFGASLTGFAVVFDFGLLKKHYDRCDQARESAHV